MRPTSTLMIEWCLCDTAVATASWSSVALDKFLERTASGDWFRRDSRRAGGKRQPVRYLRQTQDTFAIASMATKLLHRCIGAHARVHVHFLRRVCMHFDRCFEHPACTGVYVRQVTVLWTSAYTFAYTLATGCEYALMYVHFVHIALGNKGGEVELVYEGACCLAWGVIYVRRRDRSVVCVFSIFNAGGSVRGCRCVYMHTHTLHIWVTRMWV